MKITGTFVKEHTAAERWPTCVTVRCFIDVEKGIGAFDVILFADCITHTDITDTLKHRMP